MATYQTPGSYIEEVNTGNRPISGLAVGAAGFIGVTEKGPIGVATPVTNLGDFIDTFGTFITTGWLAYAIENFFLEAGKGAIAYVVRTVHYTDVANAATKTSAAATFAIQDVTPATTINITAITDGIWGNNLKFAITNATNGISTSFNVQVYLGTNTIAVESFENYTTASINGVVGKYVKFSSVLGTRPVNISSTSLAAGNDGLTSLTDADYIGSQAASTGLYALDVVDGNLNIAIPGVTTRAVHAGAAAYVEGRGQGFFIAEVPSGLIYTDARDYKLAAGAYSGGSAFVSNHMGLYYPWYYAKDQLTGTKKLIPPSAGIAGVYARVAGDRGIFKAPAGSEDGRLRGSLGVERVINDTQQAVLNPNGINVIRSFTDSGTVVWGARTCDTGALWKYVNVRLLYNYIEGSLDAGTKWAVFEPNNDLLWKKLSMAANSFLMKLYKDGAFNDGGSKDPAKAFYVLCDNTNNTQVTIDNGEVVLEAGIAPSKPGEFIRIRISQWDGGRTA